MQLEDYFDFLSDDDIRVKGTRIGIETVLYDHIHCNRSPETIAQTYPSLTLEQVYATITYYLRYQKSTDQYLTNWLENEDRMWAEQQQNPTPETIALRQTKAEWQARGRWPIRKDKDEYTSVSV